MTQTARQILIDLYESYLNDYLTVEKFSEDNGLTSEQGQALTALARSVWNSPHPEA